MNLWDRIKKVHTAVYKEEQPLAITTSIPFQNYTTTSNVTISSLPASQAYQSALGQQAFTYASYPVTTVGNGVGIASAVYNTAVANYMVPAPSGMLVAIQIYDALGNIVTIMIDQAYYQIIQEIMNVNKMMYGIGIATQSPVKPIMVDGEFSLDEMDKAELLIAELEHGQV
jgi:hypothetical protein